MRHTIAGVARDDVDILLVRRIAPNVAKTVDRLHHLARPAKHYLLGLWPTRPRPLFQPIESGFKIIRLSTFMIFTPDDEDIVSTGVATGHPYIMIWHRS